MSIIVELKTFPGSSKTKITCDENGNIKIYVKSLAQDGKANEELISLLSKSLSILKNDITIICGKTSKKKFVKINSEITKDIFYKILGFDLQSSIFNIKKDIK